MRLPLSRGCRNGPVFTCHTCGAHGSFGGGLPRRVACLVEEFERLLGVRARVAGSVERLRAAGKEEVDAGIDALGGDLAGVLLRQINQAAASFASPRAR